MNENNPSTPHDLPRQIKRIVYFIVHQFKPVGIILLKNQKGKIFDQIYQCGHIDLMIVVQEARRDRRNEIREQIERHFKGRYLVNAHVENYARLEAGLSNGSWLYLTAVTEGILLSGKNIPKSKIPDSIPWEQMAQVVRFEYEKNLSLVLDFQKSAHVNWRGGNDWLALYLLLRACERAYQMVWEVHTQQKPDNFNLDRFRRYTARFSPAIAAFFSHRIAEDQQLFSLLVHVQQASYDQIGQRVTTEEVYLVMKETDQLINVSIKACTVQIAFLEALYHHSG